MRCKYKTCASSSPIFLFLIAWDSGGNILANYELSEQKSRQSLKEVQRSARWTCNSEVLVECQLPVVRSWWICISKSLNYYSCYTCKSPTKERKIIKLFSYLTCAYYVVSICFLFLWAENASAKCGQKSLAKILQRTGASQEIHLYVEVYQWSAFFFYIKTKLIVLASYIIRRKLS